MNPTHAEQAGAVVVKMNDGKPAILLVTAKRTPSSWIFPKGHVEPGESGPDTAIRELREEAGIDGSVIDRIGLSLIHSGDTRLLIEYFLLECVDETGPGDGRRRRWCSFAEAENTLTYGYARTILQKVRPLIDAYAAARSGDSPT